MTSERTQNLLNALALALTDAEASAARRSVGLSTSACAAIVTVGQYDGISIGTLSGILGLTHSVTVRLIDSLNSAGDVERASGTDKRKVILKLTEAGAYKRQAILAARSHAAQVALSAIAPERLIHLDEMLCEMLEALTSSRVHADHICRLCDEAVCAIDSCPVERKAVSIESGRP
jgi:MarR family transcriptional regulator, negative regulator of the multidrug operon emrRAB